MAILKILQSDWTAFMAGNFAYLLTFVFAFHMPAEPVELVDQIPEMVSSWEFQNPDVDRLVDELKTRKTTLDQREIDLRELESRLRAEREELGLVTKGIQQLQDRFDTNVLRLQAAEIVNIKKIAKTYSLMEPDASAAALRSMDTDTVAKILRAMKESEAAPILQVLAKGGAADAKRVSEISERLRVALETAVTNQSR
jgi:flagellar motility protein MotE (MotC chaperone)